VSIYLINVSDAVIFIALFLSRFESNICESLNFSDYSIKTNMNPNCEQLSEHQLFASNYNREV
jgi:hypothetical protein